MANSAQDGPKQAHAPRCKRYLYVSRSGQDGWPYFSSSELNPYLCVLLNESSKRLLCECHENPNMDPTTSLEPAGPVAVLSGRSACHRRGSRMVIIHDHACSTRVKLCGIHGSTNMCRFSSINTRGDGLCGTSGSEQRGGGMLILLRGQRYEMASANALQSTQRMGILF